MSDKCIKIDGATATGDSWRLSAPMEGALLGEIILATTNDAGEHAAIAMTMADADKLMGALVHAVTSVAWIEQHGLEPTYHGPAEPPA